MAIYGSTSRFKNTQIIKTDDGKITPALMKRFDFLDNLPDSDLLTIEVTGRYAGRPDLISNRLYGTTRYKWILFLFNNVTNPFDGWPKAGTAIKVPSSASVWREL